MWKKTQFLISAISTLPHWVSKFRALGLSEMIQVPLECQQGGLRVEFKKRNLPLFAEDFNAKEKLRNKWLVILNYINTMTTYSLCSSVTTSVSHSAAQHWLNKWLDKGHDQSTALPSSLAMDSQTTTGSVEPCVYLTTS